MGSPPRKKRKAVTDIGSPIDKIKKIENVSMFANSRSIKVTLDNWESDTGVVGDTKIGMGASKKYAV